MSTVPKAVLYYAHVSIWSSAGYEEKGYGQDELEYKLVDLVKGENYNLSFLRLNSKATVPTLVVPLQKTLSEDVESRYKAITESKAIIEFLDKSRSSLSTTNTTSDAPAPALAPATLSFTSTCKIIIEDLIHSEDADPNNLLYMNARDQESLSRLADALLPLIKGKIASLETNLSEAQAGTIRASEKVVNFWKSKKDAAQVLLEVYENAAKPEAELDRHANTRRSDYFKIAKTAWEVTLPKILIRLNEEIIGPFALDSLADPHLTAWLATVISLSGGSLNDSGATAIEKLSKHIGSSSVALKPGPLARVKLPAYWDAVKERPSFKKVFANGQHLDFYRLR
ncbi:hypothetical protein GYMLUDRAFT_149698 [Collybiopsis luxurians FD-317 M1]|nr:hypothetical protein GYMLUDRAFT_149698 [Collybiopsis luxurians FD-317 M1]